MRTVDLHRGPSGRVSDAHRHGEPERNPWLSEQPRDPLRGLLERLLETLSCTSGREVRNVSKPRDRRTSERLAASMKLKRSIAHILENEQGRPSLRRVPLGVSGEEEEKDHASFALADPHSFQDSLRGLRGPKVLANLHRNKINARLPQRSKERLAALGREPKCSGRARTQTWLQ